jgi:acyl carrier protein
MALRPIIMEQLAVDEDEVSVESRVVEDLGSE